MLILPGNKTPPMENSRLQDDLLLEFKAERDMISQQLELLDPLAVSLRKPVAARLLNKGLLLLLECICWAGVAGVICFCLFRDRLYPFYLLPRIQIKADVLGISETDLRYLNWSVTGLAIAAAVLLLIIARCLGRIRKKNNILQLAGKHIKTIVGQHLKRRAAIDTIEQRHFGILAPLAPEVTDSVAAITFPENQ